MVRRSLLLGLMALWLTGICPAGPRLAEPRAPRSADNRPDKDRFGYYLQGNRSATQIQFELHSNLIIVPLRINDSDTLRFILDTGVSNTLITDPAAVKKMKLLVGRRVKITGAGEGDALTASITYDNRLSMGALRANHQSIVVMDDDRLKLSEYVGVPVHGIFGYDLFSNFVVTIDFQAKLITLVQPKKYRYKKKFGDKYPIVIEDTKPFLDVMSVVNGEHATPLRVILDTGAGHALMLDRGRSAPLVPVPDKIIRAQLGRGLNGVINGSMGRIQKIRLGRYEMNDVLTSFPDSASYGMKLAGAPTRHGNIGCELLRRFRVTFNYDEQYIVLKPNKRALRESFEHDMSGLELRAKGKEYRNYYIERIIENSPAQLAGLREGDELLFVNSSLASELTVSDIYKLLQKGEGKEVSVVVRRNGQVLLTSLTLRRMI